MSCENANFCNFSYTYFKKFFERSKATSRSLAGHFWPAGHRLGNTGAHVYDCMCVRVCACIVCVGVCLCRCVCVGVCVGVCIGVLVRVSELHVKVQHVQLYAAGILFSWMVVTDRSPPPLSNSDSLSLSLSTTNPLEGRCFAEDAAVSSSSRSSSLIVARCSSLPPRQALSLYTLNTPTPSAVPRDIHIY